METIALEYPSTIITSPTGETTIPAPLRPYKPRVTRPSEIQKLRRLPELTVVSTKGIEALLSHRAFLRLLAERLGDTPEPRKIVFLFQTRRRKTGEARARELVQLFKYFPRPFDLEVAEGLESAEDAVREAVAKIVASRDLAVQQERPDHLGKVKKVIQATEDLRTKSGKLSADKVAPVFGMSVAQLAALLGRTRQALSKTPDADSLQPLLHSFERVARLRAVLGTDDFRRWLHLGSDEFEGRTPLELIRSGKVDVVADLVEDMLTGSPN